MARLLIDHGAVPSVADMDGLTPLHFAARCGHEAVAWLLIDRGADVSAADKDGSTPLRDALQRGHEAVARLLRGRGATETPQTWVYRRMLNVNGVKFSWRC